MFDTAVAQIRLATALSLGRPFKVRNLERVVAAMRDTLEEFGALGLEASELLKGPPLDDDTRRMVQLRHFRRQAVRAAELTRFYREVFRSGDIDPARITSEEISQLPLTTKDALRRDPDGFVAKGSNPQLRAMTTGT